MAYISFQPKDFFNTTNYSGNSSTQTITTGLANDMVWIKDTASAINHEIFDTARGVYKYISTNSDGQENTAYTDNLTAFGSTGFTLGANAGDDINDTGHNYSSMNWRAGTTSGLSGGTITPSAYSINTTSKIGIYKYTGNGVAGATITHGLGTAPTMIIVKRLSASYQWAVWGTGVNNTKGLRLDGLGAEGTNDFLNNTAPSSTVITLGSSTMSNAAAGSSVYVIYAFAPVKGYSAINSYIGNGSTDGTFVYTGFKPAFVLIKNIDASGAWGLYTTHNLGYNPTNKPLAPNSNAGLNSSYVIDMYSNGFKTRHADAQLGASGNKYLYMAFAENPIVSSNDIAGVAR